ncbi:inducible metalloproteinase inhibitor protein [Aethina tumida]|uniref:inducible metalloproteinase inhibitor protein n=1 Tax=Aethina tumida TaxID=116153 RepID=UPI00214801E1|nr:inducible metalloproteinase inhibitor protein [Aethina tumida]
MKHISYILFILVIWTAICGATRLNCTKPHEHYACGSACQTTCENLGETCPIINIKCNDACYCDKDYARNGENVCIPIADCPPKHFKSLVSIIQQIFADYSPYKIVCDRPNEHYECGSACQTTCATLGQTCPIVNIRCNDGCYCNRGFARNSRNVCIPIVQCPIP